MKTNNDLWSRIRKDIEKSESSNYHRGKSWIHCYLFFRNYKELRKNTALQEYAALHLGFFLASWGMLRGSSFLLQQNYKVYIPIIRTLTKPEYDLLWNISYPELTIQETEEVLNLLFSLKDELDRKFKEECKDCKGPTNLLITKIIMAPMGCVPAYDRYFKNGLKKLGIKCYSNFSKKSFQNLLDACKDNKDIQKMYEIRRPIMGTKFSYPPMKLLDLYCWNFG